MTFVQSKVVAGPGARTSMCVVEALASGKWRESKFSYNIVTCKQQ